MKTFNIVTERRVPLADLTLLEATVLPSYQVEAGDEAEALEEFYWFVPIQDHSHFQVEVR